MFSEASKIYEINKRVKPLGKKDRQKMYSSKTVRVEKKQPQKKFSPFNTISRESRDSYLLRVTNELNTQTNYNINDSIMSPNRRRQIFNKAKFERKIGNVRKEDFSI